MLKLRKPLVVVPGRLLLIRGVSVGCLPEIILEARRIGVGLWLVRRRRLAKKRRMLNGPGERRLSTGICRIPRIRILIGPVVPLIVVILRVVIGARLRLVRISPVIVLWSLLGMWGALLWEKSRPLVRPMGVGRRLFRQVRISGLLPILMIAAPSSHRTVRP